MSKRVQENTDTPENALHDASPAYRPTDSEIDLSLLADSLGKTPWERMQANDDALNFADSLQMAMKRRYAKS